MKFNVWLEWSTEVPAWNSLVFHNETQQSSARSMHDTLPVSQTSMLSLLLAWRASKDCKNCKDRKDLAFGNCVAIKR